MPLTTIGGCSTYWWNELQFVEC